MLESAIIDGPDFKDDSCHNPLQVKLINANVKDNYNEFDRFRMGFFFRKESRIG
jgi:hypothetical protein